MKIILHDLDITYNNILKNKCDTVIRADGKYAPCQGCFNCWTKHPAQCSMKDSLQEICRIIGRADELVVISENCYGAYSPAIKNLLDRSIGVSTPMSTYRGKQMHHTLRYGRHKMLRVFSYGDIMPAERDTWNLMVQRNAVNFGYENAEIVFLQDVTELEGMEV